MKRITQTILLGVLYASTALGFLSWACSDKETKVTPEVVLANNEFTFANGGGTQTLAIQTNVPLQVASNDESWCTVTKLDVASKKVFQYQIATTANTTTEARRAIITVSGSGYMAEVVVNQVSGDFIQITNEALTIDCSKDGAEFTVNLSASGEFSVMIGAVWITQVEKTATSVKFSVPKHLGTARSATITFTCGNASDAFLVKQEAGENTMSGSDAMAIAKSFGLGWNLGNQLDAHNNGIANETSWGNAATTQAAFDKIAAAGIKSVRIPVTWLGKVGPAPAYSINEAWLNRVAEVVDYAENAGLKAIINIHHDGANSAYWLNIKDAATSETVNTQVKAQLRAMWTQIAEKFKDKGSFLVFESMNEIHDGKWGWGANRTDGGKQYAVLNEWNQVFVDAVRATGGNNTNRYLGVPGYVTNIDLTLAHFVMPSDVVTNRILLAVHYYDPHEYALENTYTEWGHTAASGKKASYGDEEYAKNAFGKLKSKFIDNGIPVYIGEMGSVHRSTERAELFRKYYLEYICKAAKTYGLAPFYWDNGSTGAGKECLGLINHATGNYINNGKDIVDTMVKAVTSEEASYTLESVYNSAPL